MPRTGQHAACVSACAPNAAEGELGRLRDAGPSGGCRTEAKGALLRIGGRGPHATQKEGRAQNLVLVDAGIGVGVAVAGVG